MISASSPGFGSEALGFADGWVVPGADELDLPWPFRLSLRWTLYVVEGLKPKDITSPLDFPWDSRVPISAMTPLLSMSGSILSLCSEQ